MVQLQSTLHSHTIIKKASLSKWMARVSIIDTNDQLNHLSTY